MFNCSVCNKIFTAKRSLTRHQKSHIDISYSCTICHQSYTRNSNLSDHIQNKHGLTKYSNDYNVAMGTYVQQLSTVRPISPTPSTSTVSPICKRTVNNSVGGNKQKKARMDRVNTAGFVEINSALDRTVIRYFRKNIENITNYRNFLDLVKPELIEKLCEQAFPIKYNLKLEATYDIASVDRSAENRSFKTPAKPIFHDTDIAALIERDFSALLAEEDAYTGRGSGFTLSCIDGLLLGVFRYVPLDGSSYIELPRDIELKKAVINPQNIDHACFKWAILAKYVLGKNRFRVGENYKYHEYRYNFTGLKFPTSIADIRIFERNNPQTSVNVYGLKQGKINNHSVFPLRVVEEEKVDHFDLLFISKDEKSHFSYISNFSRLVRAQKTAHKDQIFSCKRCFTSFDNQPHKYLPSGQEALDSHLKICGAHKPIIPSLPPTGTTLGFEAWSKTQRHPIVIYADFEAILDKREEKRGSHTTVVHHHTAMSYGFVVKASDDVPVELLAEFDIPTAPVIYRGSEEEPDVAKMFMEEIVVVCQKIDDLLKTNTAISMTENQRLVHAANTTCNLCKTGFSLGNHKVADHCHLSGKFRQTLCNTCNLKLQMPKFVPCLLHNLSNYDAHFIVTELGYDENRISVIPNSEEKFISFSKYINPDFSVRFIDSCRFMASSLSTLAANLQTDDFSKFRESAKVFEDCEMGLVTRKGVYPYEYTDSWRKLEEDKLPEKEDFYSGLTETGIDDKEYGHAENVWQHFDCKTLGEYSDLYLKIDVMLLADVFENFRDICISTYNQDPAWYYTAPGFSFDCMLKITDVKLELLSDYDMLLFFEKGIRGGLVQASMRYAKANNETMPEYDETLEKSWIIYQDCNNLYGWAMSQYMPTGGFRWVEPTLNGLDDLDATSPIGRVYEVDISYPAHLHDDHSDLPFLPENSIPAGSKVRKLMATFEQKQNYIIHYVNLKQAIANGLIVEKVHRVVHFDQSPWLAKYISLNTEMRKKAENEFEKDFYKLMNNSVFGKTMESPRKRKKMELVSSPQRIQKLINRSTFNHSTNLAENLEAVCLDNKNIKFDKPMYIGFAILEVSKSLMYEYHYNTMKRHFGDSITLMYTDTDSLVYHIKTRDFYADLLNKPGLLECMDTANLPRDHPCYVAERKKVPGLFSDETDGRTLTEFIALRAKSYAFKLDGVEKIKAKGIRSHVVKNHMTFEDHKRCLFVDPDLDVYRDNVSIRSFQHQLMTINTHKLTYNSYDDKRVTMKDMIHTLPHGHYSEMDEDNF